MREAIVSAAIAVYHDHSNGLFDAIRDRRVSDVVVVGGAGEEPVVAGIRAGAGVDRVAHIDSPDGGTGLAVHSGDRGDGCGMRITVVGRGEAGVRRDYDGRGRLTDAIGDGRVADVVVVGRAG